MSGRRRAWWRLTLTVAVAGILWAHPADGQERFALVVSGVSGSEEHAATYARWREVFQKALSGPLGVPRDHVVVLREGPRDGADTSTRERVAASLAAFAGRMRRDDLLLVLLIGHGTYDGVDAKFNLVGPDLDAEEWRALLARVPGRLVFVDTTAASSPFLARIAGPRRIVITATDTPAQQFDTVFPEYFVAAFTSAEADLDKDGRVSIGEAFSFASAHVKRYYAERGQLATERALLDDTGNGHGKEAGTAGDDGIVASRTFMDVGVVETSTDPAVSDLLARREALDVTLEELKKKKSFMPPDDYARELERVLIEYARLTREIRAKS